jgi:hypothetical protein
MRSRRTHHQPTTWIAILVILLAALAPSVSHALNASKGASWVEVCTDQGSRWVQSTSEDSGSLPSATHLMEHCPYCATQVPALGMPPAPEMRLPSIEPFTDRPPAFLAAPRTLHAWVSAQPRAPPFFS